jgi:pimeloyl-ACP methyl ester carboxylesterase
LARAASPGSFERHWWQEAAMHNVAAGLVREQQVTVPIDGAELHADLAVPEVVRGIVVFVHGSGSSRHSPRNRFVAQTLHRSGQATLLLDLLTPGEARMDARTAKLRFDIPLLATRLSLATDWVRHEQTISHLHVGYFGASTGAAAALRVAAQRPGIVHAVVSRGGRPDLAGAEALEGVSAPTLLIVGGNDAPVIALNERALDHLRGPAELVIVPGATHLFEEPGALEEVARLATSWFARYLAAVPARGVAR